MFSNVSDSIPLADRARKLLEKPLPILTLICIKIQFTNSKKAKSNL